MEKVKNISGMFWASDLLQGRLPLPQKPKQNKETEFDKLLSDEIKQLKEEQK